MPQTGRECPGFGLSRAGSGCDNSTYEPFRDLVLAWDDVVLEHQPAALAKIWKGDDGHRMFWLGATMRDRIVLGSKDRSLVLGAMMLLRPGSTSAAMPTLAFQVLPYVIDADRVGGVPNIQGALVWKLQTPFKAVEALPG